MRTILTPFLSLSLVSFIIVAGQVRETKEPLVGKGCANVTSKLRTLTVGKMRVKKCCGNITLFAQVKQEGEKKVIQDWFVQDSNGKDVKATKGWDETNQATVILTEDKKACFIIEKKQQ